MEQANALIRACALWDPEIPVKILGQQGDKYQTTSGHEATIPEGHVRLGIGKGKTPQELQQLINKADIEKPIPGVS